MVGTGYTHPKSTFICNDVAKIPEVKKCLRFTRKFKGECGFWIKEKNGRLAILGLAKTGKQTELVLPSRISKKIIGNFHTHGGKYIDISPLDVLAARNNDLVCVGAVLKRGYKFQCWNITHGDTIFDIKANDLCIKTFPFKKRRR